MYHNFSIHLSVKGHLCCFHVLVIVNSAVMNNGIHVSFSILVSSGYMPRIGIAGSYGAFIPSFYSDMAVGVDSQECLANTSCLLFFPEALNVSNLLPIAQV